MINAGATTATIPLASPPLMREHLLDDQQVLSFILRGYHIIEPQFPQGFNESILAQLDGLPGNVGNAILDHVPQLREVYDHPSVRGALVSLLGNEMVVHGHRHCHIIPPGNLSQTWHQDGTNVRHHQIWTVLGMYYPHDVPAEMGPTMIMPGTHFRNAPSDRMATYGNLKGQVALTVKAGTVAITHYDLWHAGSMNRTNRKRYMLKFLFDRTREPVSPAWNHDADTADRIATSRLQEMVGPQGYCSDFYKEWELRKALWHWMLGRNEPLPPGVTFRNMLT